MIYFISGHRDITEQEFAEWYVPVIKKTIKNDAGAKFVVGDCQGVDTMAQILLCKLDQEDVTVYHMYTSPRYRCFDKVCTAWWNTQGDYKSDIERDTAMTEASDCDIAFIRKGREKSGTAQNILRRWTK